MAKRAKSAHTKRARKGAGQGVPSERPRFAHPSSGAAYACDVAIVGGGAAGLACAVACVQEAERLGAPVPRIVVIEEGLRAGASILRSGNGRCNFSHASLDVTRFHNAAFVERAFAAAEADPGLGPVLDWFEGLGLVWSEMPGSGGLLYPFSRKADSVLAVLRRFLDEHAVAVETDARVIGIEEGSLRVGEVDANGSGYRLRITLNERAAHEAARHKTALEGVGVCDITLDARAVVVAAGGVCADEALLPADVACVSRRPILGPLEAVLAGGASTASLDGIRVQGRISLPARGFAEEGEALFRPYGVSGIVVFNASREAEPGDEMLIDLVPDLAEADLVAQLLRRHGAQPHRTAQVFMEGFLVPELAHAVLAQAGVSPHDSLNSEAVRRIATVVKTFALTVGPIADERACQVHRGGVAIDGVDPATCALAGRERFHVVGEALDVDGPCGGYNLHWAWVSGRAAGAACVREIQEL